MKKIVEFFSANSKCFAINENNIIELSKVDNEILGKLKILLSRNREAKNILLKLHNYNEFEAIQHFCICNFGGLNSIPDIDGDNFNTEFWDCNKRGTCKLEGIVCKSPKINKRELEFLKLVCEDLSDKEIADRMCISYNTATTHRQNITRKLNCKSKVGLAVFFVKNMLSSPNMNPLPENPGRIF